MAKKTILRKANTQEIANVNEEYINMAEWTGINDSTNYTSVDQSSFTAAENVYVDDENELRNRPPILSTQPFETIDCNDLEDNKYKKKIDEGILGETIYEKANSHGSARVTYEEPINPYDTWYDAYDNTGVGTYDDNDNIVSVLINSYNFTDINNDNNTCTLTYTADCYNKRAPEYIRANNPNTKEDTYYVVTKIIIESTTGLVGQLEPDTYGAGVFDTCAAVTELDVNCYVAGFSYNNMVFSGLGIAGTGVTVNFNGNKLNNSSEIPSYCFYSQNDNYVMPNLVTINFNTDIPTIGTYAFAYTPLASINIPDTITKINSYAFANSTALTTVSGNGACGFANYCFYSCTALTTVTLPNAIEFGKYCFYECTALTSISAIKATFCDDYCFYNCESLIATGLTNVTELGNYCFYECTSLISNNYESLSIIGDYCFYHNLGLTDITIGAPSSIGTHAFEECIHLVKVTFGAQCHFTIGDRAFHDCVILETIGTISSAYPIPYIDSIGEEAFRACYKLNTLDLTYTQSISTEAFYNCYELEELTLTNIVTLANEAFGGSYLKKVNIGNTLETVGTYIFEGVTTLEELDIPFIGPTRTMSTSSASADTLLGYLFSSSGGTGLITCSQTTDGSNSYISYIPESLKTVWLKRATYYPSGYITYVYAGTFSGCTMLNLVVIGDDSYPDEIRQIHKYAFYGCTSLTMVVLGHNVQVIQENAFANDTALNTVFMPKSMYTIRENAFLNCDALGYIRGNVFYEGDNRDNIDIDLGSTTGTYGNLCLTTAQWTYNYEYEVGIIS